MAIYIVTGRPRHGKTYFLAYQIYFWLKSGRRVYSNVKINTEFLKFWKPEYLGDLKSESDRNNPVKKLFYWSNISDWNYMSNGVIVVDEGTVYCNPRKWESLSESTERKLRQHGKEDLDMWITTQHFSRIDVVIRQLAERIIDVKMFLGSPNNRITFFPRFIRARDFYLEDMVRAENQGKKFDDESVECIQAETFMIRKKYYRIYDTKQSVGSSEPMPLIHMLRTCDTCGIKKISHA